jgi:uncharacterized protein
MPSKSEQLKEVLSGLRKLPGVEGSAVMSRDGISVVHDLPPAYDRDTFSAMTAAMLGAAETAMIEIGRGTPDKVTVENRDSQFVALGVSGELMLVILLKAGTDSNGVSKALVAASEQIRKLTS